MKHQHMGWNQERGGGVSVNGKQRCSERRTGAGKTDILDEGVLFEGILDDVVSAVVGRRVRSGRSPGGRGEAAVLVAEGEGERKR